MIIKFGQQFAQDVVIALGYFDTIHRAHRLVFDQCVEMSRRHNSVPLAFTFEGVPGFLKDGVSVYTMDERETLMYSVGIEHVLCASSSDDFLSLSPVEFLNTLISNYSICGIVCGEDYTFGQYGRGDIPLLSEFCKQHDIELCVLPLIKEGELKISTSELKRLIASGDIETANKELICPYFWSATVVHGRNDGNKIGFSTVNFDIPEGRLMPRKGVYFTVTVIDGAHYPSITNVGDHPTFGDGRDNIETHVIDFCSNLYGKKIKVFFLAYMRSICRFQSKEELVAQLEHDRDMAKNMYKTVDINSMKI